MGADWSGCPVLEAQLGVESVGFVAWPREYVKQARGMSTPGAALLVPVRSDKTSSDGGSGQFFIPGTSEAGGRPFSAQRESCDR